ncbi:peptidase s8 [Colletotrichum asianum]
MLWRTQSLISWTSIFTQWTWTLNYCIDRGEGHLHTRDSLNLHPWSSANDIWTSGANHAAPFAQSFGAQRREESEASQLN